MGTTELTTTQDAVPALGFIDNAVRTFEGVQQIADLMAKMGTMPAHLAGKPADCFRIVCQAAKWGMDPFAVAECTSLVHGRMCYEGKLVAAVLAKHGIRLRYEIEGKGQGASITITGRPQGADRDESLTGTVKDWRTTSNGSPWDKQPETQLVYRGTRQWARLYAPECLLGVYTPDEIAEVREVEATVRPADQEPVPAVAREVPDDEPASPQQEPTADKKPVAQPTLKDQAMEAGKKLYGMGAEGRKRLSDLLNTYGNGQRIKVSDLKLDQCEAFTADVEKAITAMQQATQPVKEASHDPAF